MAFSYNALSPIRKVDGANCKPPSTYTWNEFDVSASSSGRTEDILMHKEMIGRKVTLNCSWNGLTLEDMSELLNLFTNEYMVIEYLDAKAGTWQSKTFYIGDRSAPLYNAFLGLWENVTFNLIER